MIRIFAFKERTQREREGRALRTVYVIQTYKKGHKGLLIEDMQKEADDRAQCENFAARLSRTHGNVLAFSRTIDHDVGVVGEPVVIAQYGDVPAYLIERAG